jgi:hypothetical protein
MHSSKSVLDDLDRIEVLCRMCYAQHSFVMDQTAIIGLYHSDQRDAAIAQLRAELQEIGNRLTRAAKQYKLDCSPFVRVSLGEWRLKTDKFLFACKALRFIAAAARQAEIPPKYLTRALTKAEAAKLHAGTKQMNPSDYIARQVVKGVLTAPIGGGHSWRFDIRDFPVSAQKYMI